MFSFLIVGPLKSQTNRHAVHQFRLFVNEVNTQFRGQGLPVGDRKHIGHRMPGPDISIIIVNWNTESLLIDCLSSVYGTVQNLNIEVWVVDNGSSDGSVAAVQKGFPDVRIIQNKRNIGFAAANNKAFAEMKGRYALLLNTDTRLTPGAAEKLYHFMEETPMAAMACGQLLNRDGTRQNSFAVFPSLLSLLTNAMTVDALPRGGVEEPLAPTP